MATVNTTVDSTIYVLLSAADVLIQNVSAYPLRVAFSATLPNFDVENYHTLLEGEALLKSGGLPTGNAYARADIAGRDCKVAYSI